MQDVKDAKAVDDLTVVVELTKPNSRFHTAFLERWNALRPMPKHIFEKAEDILAFDFHPPVSLGPYVYVSHDPAGYWAAGANEMTGRNCNWKTLWRASARIRAF